MIDIKFVGNEGLKAPVRATVGAAGLDLIALDWSREGKLITYHTGMAVEVPEGHVGLLFPRSSITKYDLVLANSVGVIDSDYRGELIVKFRLTAEKDAHIYSLGDRIAQLVILPCLMGNATMVESLSETERGGGNFGSTGT